MTDKELLEKAAKAAEIEISFIGEVCIGIGIGDDNKDWPWNPLKDDGDAFKLTVKLNLRIGVGLQATSVGSAIHKDEDDCALFLRICGHENDPYAATRRAIVRAAAAIGEQL